MIVTALIAFAGQAATASLSVGATVVRPQPRIAVERGRVIVRDAGPAIVTTERRPGLTVVTLTY